jgi:hypothetical protein
MRMEFCFDTDKARIILFPENKQDEMLLELALKGKELHSITRPNGNSSWKIELGKPLKPIVVGGS